MISVLQSYLTEWYDFNNARWYVNWAVLYLDSCFIVMSLKQLFSCLQGLLKQFQLLPGEENIMKCNQELPVHKDMSLITLSMHYSELLIFYNCLKILSQWRIYKESKPNPPQILSHAFQKNFPLLPTQHPTILFSICLRVNVVTWVSFQLIWLHLGSGSL